MSDTMLRTIASLGFQIDGDRFTVLFHYDPPDIPREVTIISTRRGFESASIDNTAGGWNPCFPHCETLIAQALDGQARKAANEQEAP